MSIEKTGKRLTVLRRALGYTTREMALVVGYAPRAVRAYEDGMKPDTAYLVAVADATGVSLDWLVRGTIGHCRRSDVHPLKLDGRPFLRLVG